jgi:hypothetical protein
MSYSRSCRALLSLALIGAPGCMLFRTTPVGPGQSAELTLAGAPPNTAPIAGRAGGPTNAREFGGGCVGYIAQRPTAILHVTAPVAGLSIDVSSSEDTTLVVRHPDGSYSCNDDANGRNPQVQSALAAGDHQVFVGAYSAAATPEFTMTLSGGGAASSGGSAASGGSGGIASGTITLENHTTAAICRVEADGGPRGRDALDLGLRVAPGASATFEIQTALTRLWIVGCDGTVLFGGPNPSVTTPGSSYIRALTARTISLEPAGASVAASGERHALAATPLPAEAYLDGVLDGLLRGHRDTMNEDRALRRTAFEALRAGGADRRWVETFLALRLTNADWNISRHRRTGIVMGRWFTGVALARFPDGHCQATPVTFRQQHDGSDFSGSIVLDTISANHYMPCAVAEAAAQSDHWEH